MIDATFTIFSATKLAVDVPPPLISSGSPVLLFFIKRPLAVLTPVAIVDIALR